MRLIKCYIEKGIVLFRKLPNENGEKSKGSSIQE
jgi:hypothetical protein